MRAPRSPKTCGNGGDAGGSVCVPAGRNGGKRHRDRRAFAPLAGASRAGRDTLFLLLASVFPFGDGNVRWRRFTAALPGMRETPDAFHRPALPVVRVSLSRWGGSVRWRRDATLRRLPRPSTAMARFGLSWSVQRRPPGPCLAFQVWRGACAGASAGRVAGKCRPVPAGAGRSGGHAAASGAPSPSRLQSGPRAGPCPACGHAYPVSAGYPCPQVRQCSPIVTERATSRRYCPWRFRRRRSRVGNAYLACR